MYTLELDQLTLEYGRRPVFSGISLRLQQGETLVVAGANGSGKSSLLRLICGLQRPTRGCVTLRTPVGAFAPGSIPQSFGWVAPDLQLYRELTARENLRFFSAVRGVSRSDHEIEQLLDDVGLGGRGGDLLAAYSSGMTQRLRYAYALVHQPPVLLFDEPTATLDERGAALVERIVGERRTQCILVIATNDARELRYADYVLRLQ